MASYADACSRRDDDEEDEDGIIPDNAGGLPPCRQTKAEVSWKSGTIRRNNNIVPL